MPLSLVITLPPGLQAELGLLRGSLDDAHWLPAEDCTIPLHQLAPLASRHELAELDMALSHLHWDPFPLALHQVGHQPGEREDRLTVGITPARPVLALQKRLGTALRRAGLAPSRRPPVPELTIARLDPAAPTDLIPWIQRHNLFHTADMMVDHLTLMERIPAAGGHHIRALENYPARPGLLMPDLSTLTGAENEDEEDMPPGDWLPRSF